MSKSKISKLINDIRFVGLKPAFLTLLHTRHKESLDERYPEVAQSSVELQPGFIREKALIDQGMKYRFTNFILEVKFLAPDIVSISWSPGQAPPPYVVIKRDWPAVGLTAFDNEENSILETDEMRVVVTFDGGVIISSLDGRIIREDLPPTHQGAVWTHHALLKPESKLYGLGERAAPLNLRGGMYLMWNVDPGGSYGPGKDPLYFCAPMYLERNKESSHLVLYDNIHPGYFTLTETAAATFQGGMLRYYVIPGPFDEAQKKFFELTGKPPLPPRWALGYHQSRWGYTSQKDIEEVVAGFQENSLPISAIHLDIDYMDGFRVFSVNQHAFPDLSGLATNLQEKGINLVSIIDPGVKEDRKYFVYRQGIANGYFLVEPNGKPYVGLVWPGRAVYPDFTNPEVRAWWADHYTTLIDKGIRGFWHDMNEPTTFVAWGNNHLPLALRHNLDGIGGDHKQSHNIYGHTMAEAGFLAQGKHNPEKRPWLLTRSAWIGTHRYAWIWTGDTESTWNSLKMCIPMVLNLSLSGQLFSGPDIGGFSGSPSAELYTRWFELSTFLPFFRTHSALTTARREPWAFGEDTTQIIRKFLRLRYELLPYLYSLAWAASQTGSPMIRPMFWPDCKEEILWSINDQFFLGDNVLIAPVIMEGAVKREVTLPSGEWYDFWTGELVQPNEGKLVVEAAIDSIPIFCRARSILPQETHPGMLLLSVYPAISEHEKSLVLQLYTDAGDGPVRDENQYRVDIFFLSKTETDVLLEHESIGGYSLPYKVFEVKLFGIDNTQAEVDGKRLSEGTWKVPVDFHSLRTAL